MEGARPRQSLARVRALEVISVGDLLVRLVDGVAHFLAVDVRDDIEGCMRGQLYVEPIRDDPNVSHRTCLAFVLRTYRERWCSTDKSLTTDHLIFLLVTVLRLVDSVPP